MGWAITGAMAPVTPAPSTMTSISRAAMMLKQAAEKIAASAIRFRTSDGWPTDFWPTDFRLVMVRCRYALKRRSHPAAADALQQALAAPEPAAQPLSRCGCRLPARAADSSAAIVRARKAPRPAYPTNRDGAAPALECALVRLPVPTRRPIC